MKAPKITKWVLTPHAVARMEERSILLSELTEIISSPDFVVTQGPKWILAKKFNSRTDNLIAAVLLERQEKNLWLVITVMVRFDQKK
jgi:hypothetical protein